MSSVTILRNSLFVFAAIVAATSSLTDRAAAAPDNTLGMALMSATVNGTTISPTIVRGSGALSVSRTQPGTFDVVFNRDLSNCTCTASAGYYANGDSIGLVNATASCPYAPNTIRVMLNNGTSLESFVPFHLIVFCPK